MLTAKDFKTAIKDRILILDGAVGSLVHSPDCGEDVFTDASFVTKSGKPCRICDLLNVDRSEIVTDIHKSYIAAGADIISTNTFNSNSVSLADAGLILSAGFVYDINRQGAEIAFNVTKQLSRTVYVAGSVGPTCRGASETIKHGCRFRGVSPGVLHQTFSEQIEGLIDGCVDILLFETFYDLMNLSVALRSANDIMCQKEKTLPIVVSLALAGKYNRILSGQTVSEVVAAIREFENVICIGLNCGSNSIDLLPAVKELRSSSPYPICLYPAAGLPDVSGVYSESPEVFSANLIEVIKDIPVSILGGCCGTTPKHIVSLKSRLQKL